MKIPDGDAKVLAGVAGAAAPAFVERVVADVYNCHFDTCRRGCGPGLR